MKSAQTTIIASLFALMLVFSGIQIAEDTHLKKAEETKSSKSFGIKTTYKVCGDKVCPKVNQAEISDQTSEKIPKEKSPISQDSIIKKESTKNNKKVEATNDAIKFWEKYYKQSAPITK